MLGKSSKVVRFDLGGGKGGQLGLFGWVTSNERANLYKMHISERKYSFTPI